MTASVEAAARDRAEEPGREGVGTVGGQRVAHLVRELEERRGPHPAVEVVVQEDLRQCRDVVACEVLAHASSLLGPARGRVRVHE
jgi:hypothetical protein